MAASPLLSIQELADSINKWCFEHSVAPTNGQTGERITERNIRYYRARGLLDAPGSESGEQRRGFSPKHVCQLRVIRLFQARALPLEQIQEQLRDRSLEQLQEIESEELHKRDGTGASIAGGAAQEHWLITAVGGEFLLVSRRGRSVSDDQRRQVAAALGVQPAG